jgi:hypothetical protein
MKTTLTCGSCVDLPSKFDRFREVWGWDTEFRRDADHRPDLVTLFAKEIRSGRTVRMRLADLIATGRPTLLEACDLFAIEHMDKERKDAVRDLILEKAPSEYTSAEWALIEDYNAEDVETDIKLFLAEAATIDLAPALFRGQYSKTVACMEHVWVSVDAGYVGELSAAWPDLRMHYIHKLDSLRLYDDEGHFCEDRMAALIEAREWFWPVKPKSGKYALDARTFGQMTAKHPELKRTQQLRDQIAELRLGAFVNTIGADGHSRCPLMPGGRGPVGTSPAEGIWSISSPCLHGSTALFGRRKVRGSRVSIGSRKSSVSARAYQVTGR